MKKLLLLCFSITLFAALYSQNAATKWSGSIEPRKVFVENKGQYNGKNLLAGTKILFGTDRAPKMMYFTKEGMTFRFDKQIIKFDEKREQEERREKRKSGQQEDDDFEITTQRDVVQMHWLDANPNAEVVALDKAEGYESFSMGAKCIEHVNTYNAILYKNIYEGVDVEYRFDPVEGIKYVLIIHPGADASQIKMKYSFHGRIHMDEEGNAHLPTLFGDIIDHAPKTAYADAGKETVSSRFIQSGKTLSFELGNYDHGRTVIIDPWTVTPPLPNSQKAFYIKADSSGNAYVYGGDSPFRLVKYNAAGVYQWTYNSPWDSSGTWFGALIVDRAGNSYVTGGSLAGIAKVNTGGGQIWLNTPGGVAEYWDLAFNCDESQLIVGGMNIGGGYAYNINLGNGSQLGSLHVANTTPGIILPNPDEVRSISSSPNGNYYCLTLDSIASFSSSLTLNYRGTSSYVFSYGSPSYGLGTPQGQSCIKATSTFIYTSDGSTLAKRNIANGAIVGTATIPGGVTNTFFGSSAAGNGGIDIDSCGYIYVGSVNQVIQFDSNLNVINTAAAPSAVYDVCVSTNGDVLACGHSFAVALAMGACSQVKAICYTSLLASTTQANPPCFGQCTGTATASSINGTGPYAYLWSDGQSTQIATGLCAGSYTVTITDQGNGNTATASATITQPIAMVVATVPTNATCGNSDGSATANVTTGTGPFGYNWSNGGNTQTISNLPSGSYTVTVNDPNGCTATASTVVNASSGLTLAPSATNTNCGNNDGTATVNVTAGTGPYTYIWSNSGNTQTISNVPSGTYTVTVTGTGGCSATASVDVAASSGLTLNANAANTSCGGSNGSASVNITAGTGPYTYLWSNGATTQIISNVASGNYTVTVTGAGGCTATATANIAASSAITLSPTSTSTNCGGNNGSATATVSAGTGPYSYSWNNSGNTQTINNIAAGTYTVTVTGSGGCSATGSVDVSNSSGITLNTATTNAGCTSTGSATANPTSGSAPYTYAWSNGGNTQTINNLAAGTYIVTMTDGTGCSATANAVVGSSGGGVALSPSATNASCGANDGTASVSVTAGTAPFTYLWSTGATTDSISSLSAGTYTVTVTGSGGCTATASAIVTSSSNVTLNPASTNASCGNTNGTASVTITTGTGPFTYIWTNGGTTSSISNLSGGTYTVTVTASGGCTATATVNVASSTGVTLTINSTNTSCGNNNGSASANPTSGTAPYTYLWSNGANTSSLTSIASGTYVVTVTDAGGCSTTGSAIVNPSGGANVNITTDKTIMCVGDSAYVCAPTGYTSYLWNTGQTTPCIYTMNAGNYYITVTDNGGCTATSNHIAIAVYPQPPISVSVSGDTLTANNGVTFQWYLDGTAIPGATTYLYIATTTGNYTVAITDTNGCRAISTKASITVGIENIFTERNIKVYPNPLYSGSWQLEVTPECMGSWCEIYDAGGKLVYRSQIRNLRTELDLPVAQGVYIMRVYYSFLVAII